MLRSPILVVFLCALMRVSSAIQCRCERGGEACVYNYTLGYGVETCAACEYSGERVGCSLVTNKPLCIQLGDNDRAPRGCVCNAHLCNYNITTACKGLTCFDMSLKCYQCEGKGCKDGKCYEQGMEGQGSAVCVRTNVKDSSGALITSTALCGSRGSSAQTMNTCTSSTEYGKGTTIETCLCDRHYCNGAAVGKTAALSFVLSLVALAVRL